MSLLLVVQCIKGASSMNWEQVPRLYYLKVRNCDSIEVVFEMERCNKLIREEVAVLTQFREIHLRNLKNVRHVWSKCPRVLPRGSLQILWRLELSKCDNLRYVFTPSIAKALVVLKTLYISNCMNLEAIVAEEDDDKMEGCGETLIIFFPQLKYLSLKELPKLQQITPEPTYCINVSSCKKLELEGCGKLKKTLMSDTILEKIHALKEMRGCGKLNETSARLPFRPALGRRDRVRRSFVVVERPQLPKSIFGIGFFDFSGSYGFSISRSFIISF